MSWQYITERVPLENEWYIVMNLVPNEVSAMSYGDPDDEVYFTNGHIDIKVNTIAYGRAKADLRKEVYIKRAKEKYEQYKAAFSMIIHTTSYLQVEFIEGGINVTATKTGQRLIKNNRTYSQNHQHSWRRISYTIYKLFGTGWFIGIGSDNGLLFSGEIFQPQPDFDPSKNYYYDNDYALRSLLDALADGKTVLLPEFNVSS